MRHSSFLRTGILQTLRTFTWRQWLVVTMFFAVIGFTGLYAVRTKRDAVYWRHHREEPIRGWMTVGYVAHSYHVPPHVLYEALGLPSKPPDKRPLLRIARAQKRSIDEVKGILQDAIIHARPPPSERGTP